ncbi:OsmC family protein [Escherichia coli]|nr:OsmC family protein [Escherichia coli]MCF3343999.1 OsmC family protein [Escherichia coli]MCF3434484.1 OsmC family protein [Escherichia coli]MDF7587465.1 OsmC family protein [Escherichia coli]
MQALAGCYTATLTMMAAEKGIDLDGIELDLKEGANKQVISSQADSLIKISRIWADFFPANTSNQPI